MSNALRGQVVYIQGYIEASSQKTNASVIWLGKYVSCWSLFINDFCCFELNLISYRLEKAFFPFQIRLLRRKIQKAQSENIKHDV